MRLRPDEYPPPVRASLTVESWAQNNFRRYIRRATLMQSWGTSRRCAGVLIDPVLVPGPPGGLLLSGIELFTRDDRIHECCQMWFVRPMVDERSEAPPFVWTPAAVQALPET